MRVWHVLAIGAAIGLSSILLVPLEQIVPLNLPPIAVRAFSLVQPAILTAIAIAIGSALAPKVGLGAPLVEAALSGGSARAVLRRQVPAAVVGSIGVALILIAYDSIVTPKLVAGTPFAAKLATFQIPMTTRLLFGGIVEEILTRWGLVSLLLWGIWRLKRRPDTVPRSYSRAAILLAALLFGFGHLPILYAVVPNPPIWIVLAVIAGNALPGIIFGWLFWRRGIEAAMIAHALAHALAAIAML